MATVHELIEQIENPELRRRISAEVDKLAKQKKFGLVFEEHLPECTPLWDIPVKKGSKAARKDGAVSDFYTVLSIEDGMASCLKKDKSEVVKISVDDLVCVAEFGEPVYPYLEKLDSVCNAQGSDLWHTLIEADNYHALQLLEYLYAGKVDCIYIDPPYNTRDKDWKYNNDYVDTNDEYKHSKWLSMMQKRLKLAHKLLNPNDSVLIVTIDEKEYLHLGCLLDEMFPEARIQMVSISNNLAGVQRTTEFARSDEFAFFVMFGECVPQRMVLGSEWINAKSGGRTHLGTIRWDLLRRTGSNTQRTHSPGCFYPIFISSDGKHFCGTGEPLSLKYKKEEAPLAPEGTVALWPIRQDGSEGVWQLGPEKFNERVQKGLIKLGPFKGERTCVYYLKPAEEAKLYDGTYQILGYNEDGSVITSNSEQIERKVLPSTQWQVSGHDATHYGTRLIKKFIPGRDFAYPKSLYAVRDCIRFFVVNKPKALIVDFFAGSGTTLHAVNLINAEDNGKRQCIMVTNNEVSAKEALLLRNQGYKEGTNKWNELGIARYITWPRTKCAITGVDINGNPIKGNYGVEIDTYERLEKENGKYKKVIRLWLRDIEKQVFDSNDDDFNTAMKSASTNNIVIHLLDNSKFDILSIGGTAITTFANKIDIVDMNNLPIQKTIQFLKSSDRYRERIASFVKNADLYMDDFRYLSDNELSLTFTSDELNGSPQENVLAVPSQLIEMFHLASYYKGKIVPSIIYDSTGTKKMAALASYIIDALENGKTLIIDEIDNSLHFKLTRAIISIFNNELNQKAQLICTAHDVSLLDNKKLLRKEQIWFTHKDASQVYLYSLSEYKAEKDGIRDTTDLLEKYKKGVFGAIPEPDLFSTLMEVSNNE